MNSTKKKFLKLTTPAGTAIWPRLSTPDMKFAKEGIGHYKVTLRLRRGDDGVDELLGELDTMYANALEAGKAEDQALRKENAKWRAKMSGKPTVEASRPYSDVLDPENNDAPTGEVDINFKMSSAFIDKKNGNRRVEKHVALFDGAGGKIDPASINIGMGSKIRVSFNPNPFWTQVAGAGISLRLLAVQVLDLVEFGGGNAASHGFSSENEGGYKHQAKSTSRETEDSDIGAESAGEDEGF